MEIAFVLLLTILSIVFFVSDLLRADVVALLIMGTVLVTGLCTPEEALSGFSNRATVTVAAMFVLSAGLESTGALKPLSKFLGRMIRTRGPLLALTVTSLLTGLVSAFINNTAAVAILLPVVMSATRRAKVGPSKYLMAISFVSMAGGTMTLFGTSTNLLVCAGSGSTARRSRRRASASPGRTPRPATSPSVSAPPPPMPQLRPHCWRPGCESRAAGVRSSPV